MNLQAQNLAIEPASSDGWELVAKSFIGLVIGGISAVLMFVIIGVLGQLFQAQEVGNPLLPLVMILIAFLTTLIGTLMVAGLYSVFYGKKYYDSSKMFGLGLLMQVFLLFVFFLLYVVFYSEPHLLYYVLAFHIMFWVFISYTVIETVSNPNYAWSHLVGTTIGFVGSIAVYLFINKQVAVLDPSRQIYYLMLLAPILVYVWVPFWHNVWEKIYYQFYLVGNNFLYIPSLSEVIVTGEDIDQWTGQSGGVNVEVS